VLSTARLGFYDPIVMPVVRSLPLQPAEHPLTPALVGLGVGGIIGAALGVLQWFVYRGQNLRGWLLLSGLEGGVFGIAVLTLLQILGDAGVGWLRNLLQALQPGPTFGIVIGIGIGLAQWFALRPRMLDWTTWLAASVVAGALGASLLFSLIQVLLQWRVPFVLPFLYAVETMLRTWTMPWNIPLALAGLLFGLGIGIAQWFVLRPWLPRAQGWLLANAVGGLLGWSTTFDPVFWRTFFSPTSPIYVVGLLALMQWLVLPSRLPNAGWWIPISAVAGGVGLLMGRFIIAFLFAFTIRDELALAIIFIAFTPILAFAVGIISGGLYGIVTAFLLKRLLTSEHIQR